MDDTLCRQFFVEPDQPLHRRYLALRAFFVEDDSYDAIAKQFGVTYHTIRSWVRDFRAQLRSSQSPPFSPSHAWVGQFTTTHRVENLHKQIFLRRPTTVP
jgi:transposase-like protein